MLPSLLIVDDDPYVRAALAELLAGEGYRVVTAEHGRRALDVLSVFTPSLVLTDLSMPVLDGWDLVRAIRSDPDWARLPVVVFSADAGLSPPKGVTVVEKCAGTERLLRVIAGTLKARGPVRRAPELRRAAVG